MRNLTVAKTKASTKRSTTAKTTKPKKKKATTKKKTPNDEVTIDRRRSDRRSKKADVKAEAKPKTKAKASTKGKVSKATSTKKKRKPSKSDVTSTTEIKAESKNSVAPDLESPKPERRKVQRRRQIDPTTCERDYSGEEIEFMHALDAYKRSSGRMFPTCSEILEVIRALGYIKASPVIDTVAQGASSELTGAENDNSLSVSADIEFTVDSHRDSIDEHRSADDLIIAPIDYSSSDSLDVNLMS